MLFGLSGFSTFFKQTILLQLFIHQMLLLTLVKVLHLVEKDAALLLSAGCLDLRLESLALSLSLGRSLVGKPLPCFLHVLLNFDLSCLHCLFHLGLVLHLDNVELVLIGLIKNELELSTGNLVDEMLCCLLKNLWYQFSIFCVQADHLYVLLFLLGLPQILQPLHLCLLLFDLLLEAPPLPRLQTLFQELELCLWGHSGKVPLTWSSSCAFGATR